MDYDQCETLTLSRDELYEKIWNTPTIKLARDFGLSDVAAPELNAMTRPIQVCATVLFLCALAVTISAQTAAPATGKDPSTADPAKARAVGKQTQRLGSNASAPAYAAPPAVGSTRRSSWIRTVSASGPRRAGTRGVPGGTVLETARTDPA